MQPLYKVKVWVVGTAQLQNICLTCVQKLDPSTTQKNKTSPTVSASLSQRSFTCYQLLYGSRSQLSNYISPVKCHTSKDYTNVQAPPLPYCLQTATAEGLSHTATSTGASFSSSSLPKSAQLLKSVFVKNVGWATQVRHF